MAINGHTLTHIHPASTTPDPPPPTTAGQHAAEAPPIDMATAAKAEAARIIADAQAEAARIKAPEEAERLRLANRRAAMKLERDEAAHKASLAKLNRDREEAERKARQAREEEAAEHRTRREETEQQEKTARSWRNAAIAFAAVCAVVALPVQISMFWDPDAWWLVAAPVFLESGAWVIHRGAAAAVAEGRPHWHYRLISWTLAFIAAAINLVHGLEAFGAATAYGTAFASLAGPGVWDLHEHGRIRKKSGRLGWRQRLAQRKADRAAAAEKKAAEQAAREAAEALAKTRAETYPDVWKRALQLAAALGETTVTETVWRRAHLDVEGCEPGDSVDVIRTRNTVARRVAAARSETAGNKPEKVTNAQRASHLPPSGKDRVYKPPARPGVRRKGDSKRFVKAARTQASITAKKAAEEQP